VSNEVAIAIADLRRPVITGFTRRASGEYFVQWSDDSSGHSEYVVQYRRAFDTSVGSVRVGPGERAAVLTNLESLTSYVVTVVVRSEGGEQIASSDLVLRTEDDRPARRRPVR
jgi:hypothetical protein